MATHPWRHGFSTPQSEISSLTTPHHKVSFNPVICNFLTTNTSQMTVRYTAGIFHHKLAFKDSFISPDRQPIWSQNTGRGNEQCRCSHHRVHTTAGHQHQTGGNGNVNKRKITSSPERDYLHNTFSIPTCEIAITPTICLTVAKQAHFSLNRQQLTLTDGRMLKKGIQFLIQSIYLTATILVQLM